GGPPRREGRSPPRHQRGGAAPALPQTQTAARGGREGAGVRELSYRSPLRHSLSSPPLNSWATIAAREATLSLATPRRRSVPTGSATATSWRTSASTREDSTGDREVARGRLAKRGTVMGGQSFPLGVPVVVPRG